METYFMRCIANTTRQPWTADAVQLANSDTGKKVQYRDTPEEIHEMDRVDAAEAYDAGYRSDPNLCSFWASPTESNLSTWWERYHYHDGRLKRDQLLTESHEKKEFV